MEGSQNTPADRRNHLQEFLWKVQTVEVIVHSVIGALVEHEAALRVHVVLRPRGGGGGGVKPLAVPAHVLLHIGARILANAHLTHASLGGNDTELRLARSARWRSAAEVFAFGGSRGDAADPRGQGHGERAASAALSSLCAHRPGLLRCIAGQ